jgi:hypothetical protein
LGAVVLLGPAVARGDSWTNAAGQAMEATLISLDGERAIFKSLDGKRFAMPLASLSPASRQQALDVSGRVVVPERLRSDFKLCVNTLTRLGELRKAGKLGDDAYTDQRNAALARLKEAFERADVPAGSREKLLMLAKNH